MLKSGKTWLLRQVLEVIFGRNVINRHFFRGILGCFFSVIRGHFFNVIRGHRPANLDCRIASGNDNVERKNTSGNDYNVERGEVLKHLFRVIHGLRPANLDHRIKSGDDNKVECVTSGNDNRLGLWLRAVCNLINTPHSVLSCHSLPQGAREYGRSMIEMLGVLAIIGVLSVGGIAGYSKAMTKWKTNKTIEQTANFIDGLTTLALNQKLLEGGRDISSWYPEDIELFKTLGIIDEGMLVDGELKTPFGGEFYFYGEDDELWIAIYDLPREACMAIATATWGNGKFDIAVNNKDRNGYVPFECHHPVPEDNFSQVKEGATLGCYSDGGVPLTPDKAAYGCSCEEASCKIDILFKEAI